MTFSSAKRKYARWVEAQVALANAPDVDDAMLEAIDAGATEYVFSVPMTKIFQAALRKRLQDAGYKVRESADGDLHVSGWADLEVS